MAARLTWDISAYWISVTLLVDMCRLSHEQQNVCLNYLCHLECSVSQGSSTNYQIFVFYLAFCLQPSAENAWFQLAWLPELFFVATSTRLYQILNIKTGQFQTACSCTFTFSIFVCSNGLNFFFKLLAWVYTGSASMFSEAIHSLADTCNQALLALGISQSVRNPDAGHP